MSTLKLNNVSISFGGIKALSEVSLEVHPNAFVGLMGPNGAGKTTVINCISRVNDPQQGEITFDGYNLRKLSGDQILKLGISRTFQDLNFFNKVPDMKVIDYLKLGQFSFSQHNVLKDGLQFPQSRESERQIKRRARRILEFFRHMREQLEAPQKERGYPYLIGREGFPDLLDLEFKPISILSFAWRRRLDLARALVSNPRLLLLDEPAQGLPPTEVENLAKTLKIIKQEMGISALIVEHNVETLAKISDSLIAMSFGKLVAQGGPQEVLANQNVIDLYLGAKSEFSEANINSKSFSDEIKFDASIAPLLQIKNLDHYYGHAQTLYSISLKIKPKQVTAILGSNGSGKSTLLKVISGIEKPAFGEIFFKGELIPLGWPEAAAQRGIQYVPQGHLIFPQLNVKENLRITEYICKKRGINYNDAIEKVFYYFPDLKDSLRLQAASLSGGQQQMLAIGQAIMAGPELLLLDEPSLGLAPMLINKLFEIIKKISVDENCAIVLVEQDVNRSLAVSDYIYMLSSGILVAEGTTQQLDSKVIKKYLGFN